jgi:protein-S-isoprenylcysteine O-methyltransferase Ste14
MKELTKKAFTGLIWLQIIVAVMLFTPAWTLHFWEAWAYWLLFSVLSTVITFYFLKHDPGLVESRLKAGPTAEHEKSQKIIQTLTGILWCALITVPGIERHFHSSRIPAPLVLLGNALAKLRLKPTRFSAET